MRESSSAWSDQELIDRMRRNDTLAFHELFWRFQTLLVRYAKQLGVQPALREETVVETLNDAAVTLMKYSTPVPRSLVAYLVSSLRHRVGASARAARRVAERQREFTDAGDSAELLARVPRPHCARVAASGMTPRCSHPRSSGSPARSTRGSPPRSA